MSKLMMARNGSRCRSTTVMRTSSSLVSSLSQQQQHEQQQQQQNFLPPSQLGQRFEERARQMFCCCWNGNDFVSGTSDDDSEDNNDNNNSGMDTADGYYPNFRHYWGDSDEERNQKWWWWYSNNSYSSAGNDNTPEDMTMTILDKAQRSTGDYMTVNAFLRSFNESLIGNPEVMFNEVYGGYESLKEYFHDTDIQSEIDEVMNVRYIDNMLILGRIQKQALAVRNDDGDTTGNYYDRRDHMLSPEELTIQSLEETFPMNEAARYSRYAVAAYGDSTISAVEMDTEGKLDINPISLDLTMMEKISSHIHIPVEDFVVCDVAYHGDARLLRHYVVVDHDHKKVVLAIRGTFSNHEIAVDVVGYSRQFHGTGGEAHCGIADMTEQLWASVGEVVVETLKENEGYELIVTGHSLGGGATLLLNIILHNDERLRDKSFRSFAYAAPPVYAPLSNIPEAIETAVNYIHGDDCVPFLSGDSVRHQIAALREVDIATKDMGLLQRVRLVMGIDAPSDELVQRVSNTFSACLPEKTGVPLMTIPAKTNVWLKEVDGTSAYDVKLCDSMFLAKEGILVDPARMTDHNPGRYERCLKDFCVE